MSVDLSEVRYISETRITIRKARRRFRWRARAHISDGRSKFLFPGIILLLISGSLLMLQKRGDNSETISASGAFAIYPMMIEWADAYQGLHEDVKFEISAGGAGKGVVDALSNLVDIGMVSREVYSEEVERGAVWVAVAKDAVVITINADNPFLEQMLEQGVTPELLEKVFITGEITTWGELLSLPEYTQEINVYTRSDACGAAATFAKYLGYMQEDLLGVGVYGDPGLAEAVSEDELGLGYNNVNYAYDMTTGMAVEGLRVAPLDLDGNGVITPEEDFYSERGSMIDAIASGTYPAPPSRELNLVTKGEFNDGVLDFVKWVLTEGQGIAGEAGYVPLSLERSTEELAKLGD